jgi:hypothetical protein
MKTASGTSSEDRLEKVWQSLRAAQQLQEDRLTFGLDHVDLYVEDVGGDWLERWGKDRDELGEALVNLGEWFQQLFAAGWQSVEELLGPGESCLAFEFRSGDINRAKLIELETESSVCTVALAVILRPAAEGNADILLQVYPTGTATYLPEGLELVLLCPEGEVLYNVTARSADYVIQIEFSAETGERFSVKVALGDDCVREDFAI